MKVREAFQILAELGDDPASLERQALRLDPLYEDSIRRAAILPGSKVLELGVGTAIMSVKVAQRLGSKGRITGIDVNTGMLRVAEEKKRSLGLANLELKKMRMERLRFPDNSFDHVISNFGVCCAFDYDKTLSEAYRVLRPGGKLTYNHEGPRETEASKVFNETFSGYKTKSPSRRLRKKRQATAIHSKMLGNYTDPFVVLSKMERIGFRLPEASITSLTLVFGRIEEYLDYWLVGNLEYQEISRDRQAKFARDCSAKLGKLVTEDGLVDNSDVVFFSGYK